MKQATWECEGCGNTTFEYFHNEGGTTAYCDGCGRHLALAELEAMLADDDDGQDDLERYREERRLSRELGER